VKINLQVYSSQTP